MTTLTVLDEGFVQLPPSILQLLGLKKGDTFEIKTDDKRAVIEPKKHMTKDENFVLDDETKALIAKSAGMFKVDSKRIKHDIDDLDTASLAHHFYDEQDLR